MPLSKIKTNSIATGNITASSISTTANLEVNRVTSSNVIISNQSGFSNANFVATTTDNSNPGFQLKLAGTGAAQNRSWTLFHKSLNGDFGVYDGVGGVDRLIIDNAGRTRIPYQPSFHAYGRLVNGSESVGNYTYSSGETINFQIARVNIGSNYNTTTSIFTCPVAGTYFFWFACYNSSGTGPLRLIITNITSGASYAQGQFDVGVQYTGAQSFYCSAGDQVKVFAAYNSTTVYHAVGHNEFGGILLS